MKIFLVGFMGSGKTTFGKKLASAMDYPFFDLDHQVEAEVQGSIPDFFSKYGESAFRELERDLLQSSEYPAGCIVSTGGGTPCFFDNMQWMNEHGLTIYLDMPAQALARRLESGKHKRPLLRDLDEAGLLAFIEAKLQERQSHYLQAKLVVNGLNTSAQQVQKLILLSS